MRPAAELLLLEAAAIEPILAAVALDDFNLPTLCEGWSVRDVLAHCAAALTQTGLGTNHRFTPEDNQRDVELRRSLDVAEVVAELLSGYEVAAAAIDAARGRLDGVGLGEWMHGGDIRDALGLPEAFSSVGVELAVELLCERSRQMGKPALMIHLPDGQLEYGEGEPARTLTTDVETFVRICGGRRPDLDRYELSGGDAADLALFT